MLWRPHSPGSRSALCGHVIAILRTWFLSHFFQGPLSDDSGRGLPLMLSGANRGFLPHGPCEPGHWYFLFCTGYQEAQN